MAVMAAYILAFIVETREYTFRTTPPNRYTPWPGFAWITGTIAGALWVVAGSAAFCAPPGPIQTQVLPLVLCRRSAHYSIRARRKLCLCSAHGVIVPRRTFLHFLHVCWRKGR